MAQHRRVVWSIHHSHQKGLLSHCTATQTNGLLPHRVTSGAVVPLDSIQSRNTLSDVVSVNCSNARGTCPRCVSHCPTSRRSRRRGSLSDSQMRLAAVASGDPYHGVPAATLHRMRGLSMMWRLTASANTSPPHGMCENKAAALSMYCACHGIVKPGVHPSVVDGIHREKCTVATQWFYPMCHRPPVIGLSCLAPPVNENTPVVYYCCCCCCCHRCHYGDKCCQMIITPRHRYFFITTTTKGITKLLSSCLLNKYLVHQVTALQSK